MQCRLSLADVSDYERALRQGARRRVELLPGLLRTSVPRRFADVADPTHASRDQPQGVRACTCTCGRNSQGLADGRRGGAGDGAGAGAGAGAGTGVHDSAVAGSPWHDDGGGPLRMVEAHLRVHIHVYDFAKFKAVAEVLLYKDTAPGPRASLVGWITRCAEKVGAAYEGVAPGSVQVSLEEAPGGRALFGGRGRATTSAAVFAPSSTGSHRDTAGAASVQPLRLLDITVTGEAWPRVDTVWNHKLMHLVAVYTSLVSGSALVSTLGGGHFLCKQITEARSLARRKIEIARALGNEDMALESSVHLVYNDIQTGRFDQARARVAELRHRATQREATTLLKMLHAAEAYANNVERLYLDGVLATPAATGDPLHDDYYRQRLVSEQELGDDATTATPSRGGGLGAQAGSSG